MTDPAEAAAYLNLRWRRTTKRSFCWPRDIATARGPTHPGRESQLNRENLYRMLSHVAILNSPASTRCCTAWACGWR
ncbi:MAG: hypothetical protein R2851_03980 [Caldilineaceae bacterium]